MKLYFADFENFGDQINPWFWPKLLGPDYLNLHEESDLLVGIGTILNQRLPGPPRRKLIFGSGYGYGTPPKDVSSWKISCVRGPRTASILGIDLDLAISDPAVLVPRFHVPNVVQTEMTGFIPHWISARDYDWENICKSQGIFYIEPRDGDVEGVFSKIARCSLIICESMHGAIIADSYRIPWIAARSRRCIDINKWSDWAESVGVEVAWNFFPPMWNKGMKKHSTSWLQPFLGKWLLHLVRKSKPQLSDEKVLKAVQDRLIECGEDFVREGSR